MQNILLVYVCEMVIDIIKHSFIAKFNDIKPIAYSEFLEDLCKQVFHLIYVDSMNTVWLVVLKGIDSWNHLIGKCGIFIQIAT